MAAERVLTPGAGAARTPTEVGSVELAELVVRFRDRASLEPMSCLVELWQVGLPEDQQYTAGDRKEGEFDVPEQGRVFAGLPPGRYRLLCYDQWRGAEDPPEILVETPRVDVVLKLERPREVRVLIELRDENGNLIENALEHYYISTLPSARPEWIRPRRRKLPFTVTGSAGGASFRPNVKAVQTFPHEVGVFLEADRLKAETRSFSWTPGLKFSSGSKARAGFDDLVYVGGDATSATSSRTYLGLLLPPKMFEPLFLLPDGTGAVIAGALVDVSSSLVERTAATAWDAWRDIPVTVRASLAGYVDVEIEYRLSEGPVVELAPRTLEHE